MAGGTQTQKKAGFPEVQAMLLDGGYFRAKLNTFLSEFDIVAGGLSWGVRNSRYTIDVEFVEEAAIRHKIRVAENICKALKQDMACPHDLAPHQIQGLDYPAIAVALQWLLKRVASAREENAYFVRQHSKLQYERRFGVRMLPDHDTAAAEAAEAGLAAPPPNPTQFSTFAEPASQLQLGRFAYNLRRYVGEGKPVPAPPRVMVNVDRAAVNEMTPAEHVASVLLEYGDRYVVHETAAAAAARGVEDAADIRERQAQQDAEDREKAMIDRLATTMAAHKQQEKLSGARLGSVLAATDASKVARLRSQYEERKAELQAQLDAEEAERARVGRRRERLGELETELEGATQKLKKTRKQAKKAEAAAEEVRATAETEVAATEAMEAQVAEAEAAAREDPEVAVALDNLLAKRSDVKRLEAKLQKLAVKRGEELETLKAEIAAFQATLGHDGSAAEAANGGGAASAELARVAAANEDLQSTLDTLTEENMALQRNIDSYPTRLELQQYQTRVTELDEEIGLKYDETKLAYFRYNTAVEVRRVVENELDVFKRVHEAYDGTVQKDEASKKGKARREEFLATTEQFVKQLGENRAVQSTKLNEEQLALGVRSNECAVLLSRQQEIQTRLTAMRSALEKHALVAKQLAELQEAEELAAEEEGN